MIALGFCAVLLALGVPISFVLIATALVMIAVGGYGVLLQGFQQQLFAGIESPSMMALVLFILLGELMNAGGIGRRLLGLASAMMMPVRAGLAYVNLLANLMIATVLGSTVAQLTVMSRLAVPEMEKAGYPRDLATTITAAGSLLAPVVPPSMNLIVYAAIAQVPVGDMFAAGILPGIVMALVFALVLAWLGWRHNLPAIPALPMRQRLQAAKMALPALLVPVFAIGSIIGGLATPTEAAAFAGLASILIGAFIYRELRCSDIGGALLRTAVTSGAVLYLVAAAQVVGWVATFDNLPATIATLIQQMADSPLMFLLLLNVLLLLLGTILEPIPAIILVAPVLLPVATGVYGIDAVSFGIILCINLALGLLTPPVGAGLYTASILTGVSAERLSWLLMPFFAAVLAVLAGMSVITAATLS